MTVEQQNLNIFTNIRDLLEVGSFPGSCARYVVEVQAHLSLMIEAIQNDIREKEKAGSDPQSLRSEEDQTGMAGG